MGIQGSLFAAEELPRKAALIPRVTALARQNILIGTSSWRYEGWLGQIYTPERYFTRGKLSKTKFHEECIQEYAEVFPVVGGDFSYYGFQDTKFWSKLFSTTPPSLKWSLKIPQDITSKRFGPHAGARSGHLNPTFLDSELFRTAFLEPLAPYLDRISVLMAEFSAFSQADYAESRAFFDDLDAFLERVPRSVRVGVELRNAEYLEAGYFEVLAKHRAAHIFNSWTRMPSLKEQLEIEEAFTAPFTVARVLLRPGRSYEQAVSQFKPYRKIQDPYPSGRDALRALIRSSIKRQMAALIHVNNRFEGSGIETIEMMLDEEDKGEPR